MLLYKVSACFIKHDVPPPCATRNNPYYEYPAVGSSVIVYIQGGKLKGYPGLLWGEIPSNDTIPTMFEFNTGDVALFRHDFIHGGWGYSPLGDTFMAVDMEHALWRVSRYRWAVYAAALTFTMGAVGIVERTHSSAYFSLLSLFYIVAVGVCSRSAVVGRRLFAAPPGPS